MSMLMFVLVDWFGWVTQWITKYVLRNAPKLHQDTKFGKQSQEALTSDHKIIFLRIWTNEQFYKSYPETVYNFEL